MNAPTKPSGIPWLGDVPVHWEVRRLAYFGVFKKGRGIARADITDEGVPAVLYGDLYTQYDLKTESLVKRTTPEVAASAEMICYGDLLLTGSGETKEDIGKCVVYLGKEVAYAGGDVIILRQSKVDSLFLSYVLNSTPIVGQKTRMAKGEIVVHIYSSDLRDIVFALPPLAEQRAIAAFLDERTARIDGLVARKRRLVQLLKEKRQALITRAVTRGLDANVKLKPSGVPWLGDVPVGWEVKPLRYLGTFQNGISAGAEYFGSGEPFVNYKDVYSNPELPSNVEGLANSTIEDQSRYSVRCGDVLFTRTSETIEEIGISSACMYTIEKATFSGFLIRFRPLPGFLAPAFAKHYFRSDVHRSFFVKEMNLVTRASLGQELLKKLPVLLPPLHEQQAVADWIDKSCSRLDSLVTKVEVAIERLQEYRTALISAAVTGKVRL